MFPLPQYGHNYLTFDTVSLVPYDRKLIDTSLLSSEQVRNTVWLHDSCKEYCMNPAYLEVTVKSSPFFIKRGTLKSARWQDIPQVEFLKDIISFLIQFVNTFPFKNMCYQANHLFSCFKSWFPPKNPLNTSGRHSSAAQPSKHGSRKQNHVWNQLLCFFNLRGKGKISLYHQCIKKSLVFTNHYILLQKYNFSWIASKNIVSSTLLLILSSFHFMILYLLYSMTFLTIYVIFVVTS